MRPAGLVGLLAALTACLAISADGAAGQTPGGAQVLLLYDMEGITEVDDIRGTRFGTPAYDAARDALVGDVDAAIRGLLDAGVSEVVLADLHGSGNPDPDYDIARLPSGVRHAMRDRPFDPFIDGVDGFDAIVAIGMHGRSGGDGFLPHTFYRHTRWELAGVPMNESLLVAASGARYGIPLILVTGDDALEAELEEVAPDIAFVRTKTAVGPRRARSRPAAVVRADIERAAREAFGRRDRITPWVPPLADDPVAELGYTLPSHAAMALHYPGARPLNDRTILLPAETFEDAYRDFRALAHFTLLAPLRALQAALPRVAGGPEVLRRVRSEIAVRPSFEPESEAIDPIFSPDGRHGFR